jgi:hypothetical protein
VLDRCTGHRRGAVVDLGSARRSEDVGGRERGPEERRDKEPGWRSTSPQCPTDTRGLRRGAVVDLGSARRSEDAGGRGRGPEERKDAEPDGCRKDTRRGVAGGCRHARSAASGGNREEGSSSSIGIAGIRRRRQEWGTIGNIGGPTCKEGNIDGNGVEEQLQC